MITDVPSEVVANGNLLEHMKRSHFFLTESSNHIMNRDTSKRDKMTAVGELWFGDESSDDRKTDISWL